MIGIGFIHEIRALLPTRNALESFLAGKSCLVWQGSQTFSGDSNSVKSLGVFLVAGNAFFQGA
jgi:hypothetical protein